MNDLLSNIMDQNTPQFNKNVTEGASKEILRTAPDYLDSIIISGMKSVQDNVGLEYHGWRRLTPKEEFDKMFSNRDVKVVYDVAVSDLYMIELRFTYKGSPVNRYLYMPFTARGNLMNISNTPYHIVPVLSDTVISPNHREVFVRLLRAKLIFKRVDRNFIVDNEKIPGQIIHADIYRTDNRTIQDNLGSVVPSISLYILGDVGFREALRKYAKVTDVIVTLDNVDSYRTTHRVYESSKIKPRALKEFNYTGHDLKILVPKDQIKDMSFVDNFIFGILYTLDVFPESVYDLITILDNHDTVDEKAYWRIALGRIVFKNSFSIDRVSMDMNDHFITLNSYVDTLIKGKLSESGVKVENFFDLLAVILVNYNTWLINSKAYNSDLNNRYVDILYYLMYDIIIGINKTLFDINRKSSKKILSEAEVVKMFNTNLSPKKIYSIVKSQGMNIALALADYTGDIMYPKITSMLEDQSRGNGVKRGKQSSLPEAMKTLKGQDMFLGSLLFLSKSSNSPRFKSNLFMDYDLHTGRLTPSDEVRPKVELLDELLLGRSGDNTKIRDSELIPEIE
jgi:hypothetical protein